MNKHNYFVKILKKIISFIDSLLEKNLNKLNFKSLDGKKTIFITTNRVFFTTILLVFVFLGYILIPNIYNKVDISKKLKNQLYEKFGLNFVLSNNINYNFFPRPHFIVHQSLITKNQLQISDIKILKVFVSLNGLFSLSNISIKEVIIENTNFNLNQKNYNFFVDLLENNFSKSSLKIKASNIFFYNLQKEILFINKIKNMSYYYDVNSLQNIVKSENELFNIFYSYTMKKNFDDKKIFSQINFKDLKLQINGSFDYTDNVSKGIANFIYDKNKSKGNYEFNKDFLNFKYFDESAEPKFNSDLRINFKPFYMMGVTSLIDIASINLINSNSILVQLFKTEILNNKNINLKKKLNLKNFISYKNQIDTEVNFRILEGLIDIDNTKFKWHNHLNFEILNSLLYLSENNLILDGRLVINVDSYNNIFKFLQTPRSNRVKIETIEFNFDYNFDQQIFSLKNIKIDDKINQDINKILSQIILRGTKLQNKVYLKNLMNKVIKSYSG